MTVRNKGCWAQLLHVDESTRGDAFLNLLLINREVKDVVIISSLGCSGHGIAEFKTVGVVRKAGSRVQNLGFSLLRLLDSSLFRQQVVEILREATLKVGGAEEVEACKDRDISS